MIFEKFKEELPSKENFYSSLTDRKISDKKYEPVLNVWKNYELCPSHYLGTPDLSLDAMLKMAKIKLDFIPDLDMYIFFEKVQEVEFLIFLTNTAKATINI